MVFAARGETLPEKAASLFADAAHLLAVRDDPGSELHGTG